MAASTVIGQCAEICRMPCEYTMVKINHAANCKDQKKCAVLTEELILENAELKKLLKESIETFPTKRLADRIYKMPGIERPTPQPIKVEEDEEIPY